VSWRVKLLGDSGKEPGSRVLPRNECCHSPSIWEVDRAARPAIGWVSSAKDSEKAKQSGCPSREPTEEPQPSISANSTKPSRNCHRTSWPAGRAVSHTVLTPVHSLGHRPIALRRTNCSLDIEKVGIVESCG
jgi:hypothetical protein